MTDQANDQAPNITQTTFTAEQIAELQPTEALRHLALGQYSAQKERKEAQQVLRVSRVKSTDLVLAMAKRFDSLEAFASADNAARDFARGTYQGKGNAKTALRETVDPSYLTGCNQIRAAAGKLDKGNGEGWEAVKAAITIGALHAKANPKAKKEQAPQDADTMPPPQERELPEGTASKVHNMLCDLGEALISLPVDVAEGIIQDALLAAMMAAQQAA